MRTHGAGAGVARPRIVGVLGSARIEPDDPRYANAVEVGAALARDGWGVMTGGYGGLMEAVSRGAAEAGGEVVGLPVRHWSALRPNPWLTETRWVDSFFDRLVAFAAVAALVAIDGGISTLGEAAVAWANLQTDRDVHPPLILVGARWARIHAMLGQLLVVDEADLALVTLVERSTEVPAAVRAAIATPRESGAPRG